MQKTKFLERQRSVACKLHYIIISKVLSENKLRGLNVIRLFEDNNGDLNRDQKQFALTESCFNYIGH